MWRVAFPRCASGGNRTHTRSLPGQVLGLVPLPVGLQWQQSPQLPGTSPRSIAELPPVVSTRGVREVAGGGNEPRAEWFMRPPCPPGRPAGVKLRF